MRTRLPVAFAAASVLALGATAVTANAAPTTSGADRSGYIVVLKDSAAPGKVAREHSQQYNAAVGHLYRHAIKGYSAQMSPTAAARIADDRRVLFVQEDGVVTATGPTDQGKPGDKGKPGGSGGGSLPAQSTPTGINRVDADLSPTAAIDKSDTRVGVDVAVIDTGVDTTHLDLVVAGGVNCSTGNSYADGNGHGTHVAGTIGAKDDTVGVVGVAPGARIWAVRVLNNAGSGTFSGIVCGIDWVTANAGTIEVANMSLGGSGSDTGCGGNDAMHRAICNSVAAGVTYVVAAGNESDDAANHVPAAYDEVITVSALADFDGAPDSLGSPTCRTDEDDTFANFSNYGADVDIIAPGVCITSTWKGGGYDTISGTSMASPHVAGGAALYLAAHAGSSPATVKSALQNAGTLDWDNSDDPDEVAQERLLNVGGF